MEKGPLYIYYASQGGTAASFAQMLQVEATEIEIECHLKNISTFKESDFKNEDFFIFVVATHYEGNCPDDADNFKEWMETPSDKSFLKGKKVTLFGLGDSTYDTFNFFSKQVFDFFTKNEMELFVKKHLSI